MINQLTIIELLFVFILSVVDPGGFGKCFKLGSITVRSMIGYFLITSNARKVFWIVN